MRLDFLTDAENELLFKLLKKGHRCFNTADSRRIFTRHGETVDSLYKKGLLNKHDKRITIADNCYTVLKRNGMQDCKYTVPESAEEVLSALETLHIPKLDFADLELTARRFFLYYNARGWVKNGKRIIDWIDQLEFSVRDGWVIVKKQAEDNLWSVRADDFIDVEVRDAD